MEQSITSDGILSAIIAISVFILGYILNRFYSIYVENKRLKKIKIFYFEVLKTIVSELGIEDRNYRGLTVDLLNHKVTNFTLINNHNLVFESLDYVSHDDLFKCLKLDKKRNTRDLKKYRDLISSISFLRKTQSRTKENFIDFTDRFFELQQIWNQNLEDLFNQIRIMRVEIIKKASDIQYSRYQNLLGGIEKIIQEWVHNENHRNFETTYIELLRPLLDHFIKFNDDELVLPLTQSVIKCIHIFNNMENLRDTYRKEFDLDRKNINVKKKKLEECIEYFYS